MYLKPERDRKRSHMKIYVNKASIMGIGLFCIWGRQSAPAYKKEREAMSVTMTLQIADFLHVFMTKLISCSSSFTATM